MNTDPKKILCALVPAPDGGRVLCRVMDYPILTFAPPYKPLVHVRRIHGRPFGLLKDAVFEMGQVEFKFMQKAQL